MANYHILQGLHSLQCAPTLIRQCTSIGHNQRFCMVAAFSTSNSASSSNHNKHGVRSSKLLQNKKFKFNTRHNEKPQSNPSLAKMIKPIPLKPISSSSNIAKGVGKDFAGELRKGLVIDVLNQFYRRPEVKSMALEQGMEHSIFVDAFTQFRKHCASSEELPADLHIKLSDICRGYGSEIDLFPYFIQFSKKIYPHLECIDDLKYVSNLTQPANWFPYARSKQRKIIIHAGPTNSGKTYHAFQRYLQAKSAVYCGPLKMLAVEIAQKSNEQGIPCDLVTGEERKLADPDGKLPAAHVSCTVEMCDIERPIEVAIIDEIQMLRDSSRGWAWLRAFLGVNADEVHLCGESTVIDLIKDLSLETGDMVEVKRYERLTPIEYMQTPVGDINNIQDGDCIVCFSKSSIYTLCRELEKMGRQCAVIYGSLPPVTKLAQAAKFNDPNDPCKILIATDAIGMGLNLNIRRIIFHTLTKVVESSSGLIKDTISPSQALQIAGRCGRFGTKHEEKGYVTTFYAEDLPVMHDLLKRHIEPISKAGIHPTADQLELFGYYLPHASMSELLAIFINLMTIDADKYFLCVLDQFTQIAEIIEHVPMPLRTRYVFCCAPIPTQSAFVTTMLLKFARRFSAGEAITVQWLQEQIDWPLGEPVSLNELTHLEAVHDTLDLYCWLSYRFEDIFPDRELVKEIQVALDLIILEGVNKLTRLVNMIEEDPSNIKKKELNKQQKNIARIIEKMQSRHKS